MRCERREERPPAMLAGLFWSADWVNREEQWAIGFWKRGGFLGTLLPCFTPEMGSVAFHNVTIVAHLVANLGVDVPLLLRP